MKITLEVGDWSNDGHSQSDTFTVESSLDAKALKKAYAKGTKKIGFDLSADVCKKYEDSQIPMRCWDKLIALEFDDKNRECIIDAWDSGVYVTQELFVDMWIFICQLGNPDLKIEICHNGEWIEIGGYGLFYC